MLTAVLLAASLSLPGENLLLGRAVEGRGLTGAQAATDGRLAGEGAAAGEEVAAGRALLLAGSDAVLVVDLGSSRTVGAILLQADAGDAYMVETSLDGRSWSGLLRVEPGEPVAGMRTRKAELPEPRAVRFLLVRAEGGDGTYAVGELAAWTSKPPGWKELAPPPPADAPPSTEGEAFLVPKAVLALAAALLLLWGLLLRHQGRERSFATFRDRALAALGLLSALAFFNFGRLHGGRFVHVWDSFHYVVGVKYFPELGYTGLYEAALAAERAGEFLPPASVVPLRDLATNALGTANADEALARGPELLGERWEPFVADVLWFRAHAPPGQFRQMLVDHGYNATPAWGILGGLLARSVGPATDRSVLLLALVDPILLLGAWLLVRRAFGWRTACVALVFWGTNFPGRFLWNGGSFLRMDWLASAMAGVALLKLGRPRLAGAALALSTLLRVFPGALLLAVGVTAAVRLARERRLAAVREEVRVAQGALATVLFLVPLSLLAAGGFEEVRGTAWSEFAANSRKHLSTPLTNNVGLGTALTWRPAANGEALVAGDARDPWARWKQVKRSALHSSLPVRAALAAVFLAATALALARHPPWAAAAAGAGLVFVLVDLTCYYASVLLLLGLLAATREEAGVVTSLLAAATGAAPFLFAWDDDVYALVSVLVLAAFTLLLVLLARQGAGPVAAPTPRAPRRRTSRPAPTPGP